MTDKQIIYNCPHISFTDWGTYACKLYNPRDSKCLVRYGNCESNTNCPYKQNYKLEAQFKQAEQKLAKIKDIIRFNKTNRLSGGACISIEQILQKISEVEE